MTVRCCVLCTFCALGALLLADTSGGDSGSSHTGSSHTGSSHTGSSHTGSSHTGSSHTASSPSASGRPDGGVSGRELETSQSTQQSKQQSIQAPRTNQITGQSRLPKMTRVREAAAIAFADEHHPDLRQLLDFLRRERPQDYREALYDLYQTSERIAQFQDRDDLERYELELKLWQVQSRIQLLSARYKVRQATSLRNSLAAALEEELDLRIQIREHLRHKVQQRVNRLDESISRLKSGREKEVQRKLRLLTKAEKPNRTQSERTSAR